MQTTENHQDTWMISFLAAKRIQAVRIVLVIVGDKNELTPRYHYIKRRIIFKTISKECQRRAHHLWLLLLLLTNRLFI
jgi:hypothetical protein